MKTNHLPSAAASPVARTDGLTTSSGMVFDHRCDRLAITGLATFNLE